MLFVPWERNSNKHESFFQSSSNFISMLEYSQKGICVIVSCFKRFGDYSRFHYENCEQLFFAYFYLTFCYSVFVRFQLQGKSIVCDFGREDDSGYQTYLGTKQQLQYPSESTITLRSSFEVYTKKQLPHYLGFPSRDPTSHIFREEKLSFNLKFFKKYIMSGHKGKDIGCIYDGFYAVYPYATKEILRYEIQKVSFELYKLENIYKLA